MATTFFKKLEVFWFKILYLFSFVMFCLFIFFSKNMKVFIIEFILMDLNSIHFSFPIIIDSISLSFSCILFFISGSVVYFSNYYMEGEKFMNRFSFLILIFILSMNFLIFVPNLVTLLLGWDGLGVVSFLLVIFYQNPKSLGAGIITFLSNRMGDALLIVSIGLMGSFNSWNVFWGESKTGVVIVLWCIVIASMTKSAQIPFSAWLPAAMAAPTPVSALVHSSTLVTAGVYLLIRFHDQIYSITHLSWYLVNIGALTTLMAGMSAVCETDLKKVIALSTLSQLGVMMFSLGLGLKELCIFHLFSHALFKALLFMCAGSMIHSHHHLQDVRKLGACWYFMPITSVCMNIANLSLCGFPFLAGFYSKDLILESMVNSNISFVTLVLMIMGTLLTTMYSVRLTYFSLVTKNSFSPMSNKLEESKSNIIPILLMTMVSVLSGPCLYWLMNMEVIEPLVNNYEKFVPLFLIGSGFYMAYLLENSRLIQTQTLMSFYACSSMWFIAPLSTQPILSKFFHYSENNIKIIDQGWNEFMGGQGIYKITAFLSKPLLWLQTWKFNFFVGFGFFLIFFMVLTKVMGKTMLVGIVCWIFDWKGYSKGGCWSWMVTFKALFSHMLGMNDGSIYPSRR